jgi:hypothetical protein
VDDRSAVAAILNAYNLAEDEIRKSIGADGSDTGGT